MYKGATLREIGDRKRRHGSCVDPEEVIACAAGDDLARGLGCGQWACRALVPPIICTRIEEIAAAAQLMEAVNRGRDRGAGAEEVPAGVAHYGVTTCPSNHAPETLIAGDRVVCWLSLVGQRRVGLWRCAAGLWDRPMPG